MLSYYILNVYILTTSKLQTVYQVVAENKHSFSASITVLGVTTAFFFHKIFNRITMRYKVTVIHVEFQS